MPTDRAKEAVLELVDSLCCRLCSKPFTKPYSFHDCTHTFCQDCVISTLEGPGISKSECPICSRPAWKNDLKYNHKVNNTLEYASGLQQHMDEKAAATAHARMRRLQRLQQEHQRGADVRLQRVQEQPLRGQHQAAVPKGQAGTTAAGGQVHDPAGPSRGRSGAVGRGRVVSRRGSTRRWPRPPSSDEGEESEQGPEQGPVMPLPPQQQDLQQQEQPEDTLQQAAEASKAAAGGRSSKRNRARGPSPCTPELRFGSEWQARMLALPPPTAEELPALREEIALLEEALRLCDELPCADDSSSDGSGGSSREEGDSGSGEVGPMDGAGGAAVLHREATEAQAAPAGEPASKQRVAEQPLSDGDGREGGRQLPARKRRKSSPGHGLPATGNQPAVHLCGDAGPQPNGGHNSAPSGEGRHLAARSARSSAEVVPIAAQAVGDEAGEEPEGAVLDEDSATDDDLAHQQFERLPAGRPAPGQRPQPQQKQELGWKGGSGAPAARGAGGAPRAVAPPPLPGLQEHERRQDAEQAQRGDQQEGQEEEEPSPLEQEEGRQLQGNHGANSPALLRAAATDSTELSQRCLEPDCDGSCAEGGPGADAGARSDMELLLQETAPEQVVPSAGGVSAGPSNGRAAVTAAALQVGQAVGRAAVAGPDSNPGGKGSGKAHDAYTFLPSSSSSSSEDSEEELARLQRRRRGHRAFAGQRDSADLKQPAQVGEAGTAPPAVQQFSRKGRGWTAQGAPQQDAAPNLPSLGQAAAEASASEQGLRAQAGLCQHASRLPACPPLAAAAQAEGLASVCNLFNPASPDAPPAAGLASAGGADDGPSAAPRATDGCRFVVVSLGAGQGAEEAAIRARLRQLASSLGGCVVEEHVSNRTTHVLVRLDERGLLAGRTMKALLGLAGGCWLLSCVWLNACAEAGEWLPERPYEAQGGELEQSKRPVCGGPHRCRVRRGAQGCGLLAGRRMHVAGPPAATAGGPGGTTQGSTQAQAKQRADIERLLEMAEAEVVRGEQTAEKEADVDVVAPWGSTAQLKAQFGRRLVSSRWVFDSLISGEERSMRDYRL